MIRSATAALAAAMLAGVAHAEIRIFKQPDFSGDAVTVRNSARDLAPLGITDQASSLVVGPGRWQVCTQPDFQGDCRVLEAGRYARLDPSLNHRIESVRQVERTARRDEGRYGRHSYQPYSSPGYEDRAWRDGRDWQDRRGHDFRNDERDWNPPYSGR